MAEVYRSTAQTAGLPETLATVLKWRDASVPLSEEDFTTAIEELGNVLGALETHTDASGRSIRVLARMVLGNLHRDHGLLDHAIPFYDAALENPADINDGTSRGKNELANLFTNRGICRLTAGNPEQFPAALADFDAAIELRRDLPLDEDSSYRWGLSAGLMNRGDVLHRLGERNAEATAAYDEAIGHLKQLPYEENPGMLQRYALAWANRGLVIEDPAEARRCFDECIRLLSNPQNPQQLLTLCNATLNRGRHALQTADDTEATAADARQALALIAQHERSHPAPAEMALQARHLLAHALCAWLDGNRKGPGIAEDWIGDATDTVEEALALERFWEQQGVTAFRPLASDLFQLGLHVYRVCQPHFFADFLIESMDPEMSPGAPFEDSRFQAAAARSLQQAVNEVAQRAASATLDPEFMEKQQKILKTLKVADHRLAELQRSMQTD